MSFKKYQKSVIGLTLLAVFLVAIFFIQFRYNIEVSDREGVRPLVIPAKIIKGFDLGLHSAMAGAIWVYSIQHATRFPEDLPALIRIVNELDPKFSYPYAFATLILPAAGLTSDAIEIGKRGVIQAPDDWRIPYYLGTIFHVELNDRKNAAIYFDIAARNPNAYQSVKLFSARYGSSDDLLQQTYDLWKSIYETSNDEMVRNRAAIYIVHFENIMIINQAVKIYKLKYDKVPQDIVELVNKKILRMIPPNPFGFDYYLDEDGRVLFNQ